jgi:hypothetical protein
MAMMSLIGEYAIGEFLPSLNKNAQCFRATYLYEGKSNYVTEIIRLPLVVTFFATSKNT